MTKITKEQAIKNVRDFMERYGYNQEMIEYGSLENDLIEFTKELGIEIELEEIAYCENIRCDHFDNVIKELDKTNCQVHLGYELIEGDCKEFIEKIKSGKE